MRRGLLQASLGARVLATLLPNFGCFGSFLAENLRSSEKSRTFATGKSYTTSSPRIPQVLTEARVLGRSGAM